MCGFWRPLPSQCARIGYRCSACLEQCRGCAIILIGFNSSGADASDIIRAARLKYEKWCPGWGGLFGASFVRTD